MTINDIITGAMQEIGVISPGEPVEAALMNWGLTKANQLVDAWGTDRMMIFSNQFQQFTLTPALSPHTIGTGAIITATSLTNNVATYTGVNSFQQGQLLYVVGSSNGGGIFNVSGLPILGSTPTSFTVGLAHINVGSASDKGIASTANPPPTWIVLGNRPTKIVNANLIINTSTPAYNIPIHVRDADWWASQRVQQLATNYPTDLYYEPDWPNGSCYFWPVPQVSYPVQLETWTQIVQFVLNQMFSMPPGYQKAVQLSLAVDLIPSLAAEVPPNPILVAGAAKARNDIKQLNTFSPRISTGGDGLPSKTSGARSTFNWRTGFDVSST